MNQKRKYPLFVIDSSREHGRGSNVDYISCTSNELPFVASVTLHERNEYSEIYNADDVTTVWSDERNGIRLRVKVISDLPAGYKKSDLISLLRRALKEIQIRHRLHHVDVDDITNDDVVKWCNLFLQQVMEELRNNPDDKIQKMNNAILNKILEVFVDDKQV